MITDNEIRIKHETKRKLELYFLLNNIRRNLGHYNKKENDKKE